MGSIAGLMANIVWVSETYGILVLSTQGEQREVVSKGALSKRKAVSLLEA